jgi:deferrochelatase/peroxidase EfeB
LNSLQAAIISQQAESANHKYFDFRADSRETQITACFGSISAALRRQAVN